MVLPNIHGWPRVPQYIHKLELNVTRPAVRNYAGTVAIWGAFLGTTLLFLLEPAPITRKDVFSKLPIVGQYWRNKLPAEESE